MALIATGIMAGSPAVLAQEYATTSSVTFSYSTQQGSGLKDGSCTAQADSPHYSKGAASVIYKTRVTCTGAEPPQIRVQGQLHFAPGGRPGSPSQGPASTVASSDETQIVTLGKEETFYTPLRNTTTVKQSGTYLGSSTVQVVAPVVSGIQTSTTGRVYVGPLR